MNTTAYKALFILLVVFGMATACKEKEHRKDATFLQVLQPSVVPMSLDISTPQQVQKASPSEPLTSLARPSSKLGPFLDEFNACVAHIADIVRSSTSKTTHVPADNVQECRRRLDAILAVRGMPITEAYTEYFVRAARLIELLSTSADASTNTISVPVNFIENYNAFAIENNELLGIPVTEPMPLSSSSLLPRRTYRDELARLALNIHTQVIDWHFHHRFEILGANAKAAWLNHRLAERAKFFVLRNRMEARLATFFHIQCENSGTSSDDRFPCQMLENAGKELARYTRAWLDAWDTWLQTTVGPTCSECERTQKDIEQHVRSLPEAIQ